jgi:transcriptional regulator with XRE-family HTH domain
MPRRQRLVDRRNELGLSQADVAHRAGLKANTVRRYELGLSQPRTGDRRAYAEALEWTPERLTIAISDEPPPVNGHAVPGWLDHLGSLEQAAAHVGAWEPVAVHGLLQTPEYATAVERADATSRSSVQVEERVAARIARQSALHRDDQPVELSVVLDESVLLRVAGDRGVMAGQLDHLLDIGRRRNVELRVLPLSAGRFSAAFGSFYVFTQPGAVAPYMAVTHDRAGPHYHDRQSELHAHAALLAHLTEVALPPGATVQLIEQIAKEHYR